MMSYKHIMKKKGSDIPHNNNLSFYLAYTKRNITWSNNAKN